MVVVVVDVDVTKTCCGCHEKHGHQPRRLEQDKSAPDVDFSTIVVEVDKSHLLAITTNATKLVEHQPLDQSGSFS